MDLVIHGLICSSIAIIWTDYLTWKDGLLNFLRIQQMKGKIGELLRCSICLSGQIALWSYLIMYWSDLDWRMIVGFPFLVMLTTAVIVSKLID